MFLGVRRFLHSWTWCTDQKSGLFWLRSEYCLCFSFLANYNCLKYSYWYVCLLPRFVCEIRLLWERGLSNSPTWLLKQLMANHTEEWLQHVARNTTECMDFPHAICWAPGACTGTELSVAPHCLQPGHIYRARRREGFNLWNHTENGFNQKGLTTKLCYLTIDYCYYK